MFAEMDLLPSVSERCRKQPQTLEEEISSSVFFIRRLLAEGESPAVPGQEEANAKQP